MTYVTVPHIPLMGRDGVTAYADDTIRDGFLYVPTEIAATIKRGDLVQAVNGTEVAPDSDPRPAMGLITNDGQKTVAKHWLPVERVGRSREMSYSATDGSLVSITVSEVYVRCRCLTCGQALHGGWYCDEDITQWWHGSAKRGARS